jgi:acetyl/propionyl-CoA carboxylase alpha subunit
MVMMSDKSKAKDVMIAAGVPVVPGSDGAIKDIAEAKVRAKRSVIRLSSKQQPVAADAVCVSSKMRAISKMLF